MAQFPQVPEPCAPGISPVWAIRALQLWLSHNFCECAGGWDWIVVLKAWQLLLWTPLWVGLPLHTAVRDAWQWILRAFQCVSPSITGCKAWLQLLKACWDMQQVSQSRDHFTSLPGLAKVDHQVEQGRSLVERPAAGRLNSGWSSRECLCAGLTAQKWHLAVPG